MLKCISNMLNRFYSLFDPVDNSNFLKGPELPSKTGDVKYLAIAFHGYRSNGENLINIAPFFQETFHDLHFISPNGVESYENDDKFFQWGSLANLDPEILYENLESASVKVNSYIDKQLKRFNLTDKNLILIGFSQGGSLALHVGLRREHAPLAILSFSGYYVDIKEKRNEIKSKPQIALLHGTNDDVVPYFRMEEASHILGSLQIPVKTFPIPDVYHSINKTGIDLALKFLEEIIFPKKQGK